MKKTILSIATASALMFSSVNASGIPTFDGANIAQAIMDYMQQLKDYEEQIRQYEQMVKDTLNFEKQMAELGVDMNDINEILGEATQMINSMKNIYNDIKNIPEDIMGNVGRVKEACNFLEQHSEFFSIELSKVNDGIQGKANRCMYALQNGMNVSKTIDGLTKDMHKIIDPIERANLQAQINNIKNVEMFIQTRDNIAKTNKLLTFEDAFYNADKTNKYSQVSMQEDLKTLSNQLSKANNQKQAQALTNTILLKILENLQYQYELNINYTSTVASNKEAYSKASNLKNLTQESFNQQVVEYKRNDDLFQPETKQLPKDELGLPKFIFFKK